MDKRGDEEKMADTETHDSVEKNVEGRHRLEHDAGDPKMGAGVYKRYKAKNMGKWNNSEGFVPTGHTAGWNRCLLELNDIGDYSRVWEDDCLSY
jgi:hypothetical protein